MHRQAEPDARAPGPIDATVGAEAEEGRQSAVNRTGPIVPLSPRSHNVCRVVGAVARHGPFKW